MKPVCASRLCDGTVSRSTQHHDPPPSNGVTARSPDLPVADAFATAAFAMGRSASDWCAHQRGLEFMLVTEDEHVLTTAGFDRYRTK